MEKKFLTKVEALKDLVIEQITAIVNETLDDTDTNYIVLDGCVEIFNDLYVSEIYKENGMIEFQDDDLRRYKLDTIDYYDFPTESLAEICDYLMEYKYKVFPLSER